MKIPSPFSNPSLQTLFNIVPSALLLVDDAGLIVEANPAALALLGYTKAEMIGLKVEALMPAGYRAEHAKHREMFNRAPQKRPMGSGNPLFALKHDGTELRVDISLDQLRIDDAIYTLAMMQITDRRHHAEDSLKLNAQRLRLAKQAAHLGVFDFNADRELLDWDERMRELWGAESAGAMAAHKFTTIIHPLDRAARQAALDHAIDPTGSGEYNFEYRVIDPGNDAVRWVSAVGKAHFIDNEPIRLIGVARDITSQKLLEQNLVKHRNEAETAFTQQVASLTASAIAHELNQPLAAISAYGEVALCALESEVIDQESLRHALDGCVKQSQRAGRSLHELLGFLQKGDLIREPLDLNEIVKESLVITKSSGHAVFYPMLQLEPNMPKALGNRTQIIKILVNLLRNAAEAMHGAGMPSSTITIIVRTNADINMAHVTVRDSGPGMDTETAKRIFEPFFTTKPTGIGMGLAISRALAEANGGQLWLEAGDKPHATFHFTLPFAP